MNRVSVLVSRLYTISDLLGVPEEENLIYWQLGIETVLCEMFSNVSSVHIVTIIIKTFVL